MYAAPTQSSDMVATNSHTSNYLALLLSSTEFCKLRKYFYFKIFDKAGLLDFLKSAEWKYSSLLIFGQKIIVPIYIYLLWNKRIIITFHIFIQAAEEETRNYESRLKDLEEQSHQAADVAKQKLTTAQQTIEELSQSLLDVMTKCKLLASQLQDQHINQSQFYLLATLDSATVLTPLLPSVILNIFQSATMASLFHLWTILIFSVFCTSCLPN